MSGKVFVELIVLGILGQDLFFKKWRIPYLRTSRGKGGGEGDLNGGGEIHEYSLLSLSSPWPKHSVRDFSFLFFSTNGGETC